MAIDLCSRRPAGWPYHLRPIYVGDIEEAFIVYANGMRVEC